MAEKWPAETRDACLAALEACIPAAEVAARYNVPEGTVKSWAHRAGIKQGPATAPAPPRTRGIPAEKLPPDIRRHLRAFVNQTAAHLGSATALENGKNTADLARALHLVVSLTPDLLTYEERLDRDGDSDSATAGRPAPDRVAQAMDCDPGDGSSEE